jgi:hypothetical protein
MEWGRLLLLLHILYLFVRLATIITEAATANLIVGQNNSGKSTLLLPLLSLQKRNPSPMPPPSTTVPERPTIHTFDKPRRRPSGVGGSMSFCAMVISLPLTGVTLRNIMLLAYVV